MAIHGAALRTLAFICSEFVRRLYLSHPADYQGSDHKRRGKRRFIYCRVVSQFEQERCALQEGLASAQHAIDWTTTLMKEAQAARVTAHTRAMLSHLEAQAYKPSLKAA